VITVTLVGSAAVVAAGRLFAAFTPLAKLLNAGASCSTSAALLRDASAIIAVRL
jgi:hypothetical protein